MRGFAPTMMCIKHRESEASKGGHHITNSCAACSGNRVSTSHSLWYGKVSKRDSEGQKKQINLLQNPKCKMHSIHASATRTKLQTYFGECRIREGK